jgi:hypothetical protein
VAKDAAKSKSQSISVKSPPQQSAAGVDLNTTITCLEKSELKYSKETLTNFDPNDRNNSNSSSRAIAAAIAAATTPKSTLLDDSITFDVSSIDILSDDANNTTLNTTTANALNYSYSPSTTSLADISTNSIQQQSQQNQSSSNQAGGTKNTQFNQKLKNLRRSFNSKTSTSIGKHATDGSPPNNETSGKSTLVGTSSSTNLDKSVITSLSYMTGSSCFQSGGGDSHHHNHHQSDLESYSLSSSSVTTAVKQTTPTNGGTPGLIRKPSETNLLYIKNQIDLNVHHEKLKGGFLFFSSKKKIADQDLMLWTSQTIQKPLIKTNNKVIKKEACELFKLIQTYMGDRKQLALAQQTNDQPAAASAGSATPNSKLKSSKSAQITSLQKESASVVATADQQQMDAISLEIMTKGWQHPQLRDELYLQIVKQTTANLNKQSFLLGWQLMAICLSFFPPTQKLYPFLSEYILAHTLKEKKPPNDFDPETADDPETDVVVVVNVSSDKFNQNELEFLSKLARICLRRLERIQVTGAKKGLKSPSLDEIILSKSTILNPSLFGTTLEEIMSVQRRKFPNLTLPWVQKILSEAVLKLNGAKTEGIFRVPGDLDEVNNLKVKIDQLWCQQEGLLSGGGGGGGEDTANEVDDLDLIRNIQDPHLPASLLKLWYRELHEPLIPNEYYDECISGCDQADKCLQVIEKLPKINRQVFTYLIKFLKAFASSENVAVTKMDANNLSMVMAPNCLRCKSNDPKIIMENTKKEMLFIKTLIQHLDTTSSSTL